MGVVVRYAVFNLLLIILAAAAAHADSLGSVVVDRVLAVVNGDIITMSDVQREEALKKASGAADRRQLLEDMIDRRLQMAAAKRAGMDVSDKELTDAVADIMKRNSLDLRQFEAALAKEGLTLDQYKTELREQMTLSRMFNKYVRATVSVDESELRAYYERNRGAFALPEEVRLRRIFFPIPENASAEKTAEVNRAAQKVFERANKGEDFIGLVRSFSETEAARQDGDLGFVLMESLRPEMEAAVRTLKPGEVAPPFLCAGGYQVVRLEEVRTPVKPFEKVKDELMNTLSQQKLENTYRSWLQTLRGDAAIDNRL
jgi:peptidyl-prolyl cis-trans isomerase SurA